MEGSKPWYTSKTIWGSIVQVAAGVAVSMGVISGDQSVELIASGPELITGVVVGLLGFWNIFGRMKATKTIT